MADKINEDIGVKHNAHATKSEINDLNNIIKILKLEKQLLEKENEIRKVEDENKLLRMEINKAKENSLVNSFNEFYIMDVDVFFTKKCREFLLEGTKPK